MAAVAAIVQKFDLQRVPREGRVITESPVKKPVDRLSLFPLMSAAQWRLTRQIMAEFDNPYLAHARSPEDIGLSRRLYERNPTLDGKTLQQYCLGWLWARESQVESEKRNVENENV